MIRRWIRHSLLQRLRRPSLVLYKQGNETGTSSSTRRSSCRTGRRLGHEGKFRSLRERKERRSTCLRVGRSTLEGDGHRHAELRSSTCQGDRGWTGPSFQECWHLFGVQIDLWFLMLKIDFLDLTSKISVYLQYRHILCRWHHGFFFHNLRRECSCKRTCCFRTSVHNCRSIRTNGHSWVSLGIANRWGTATTGGTQFRKVLPSCRTEFLRNH